MALTQARRLPPPEGAPHEPSRVLAFSPDGSLVAVDDVRGTGVRVVDVEAWRVVHHLGPADCVRFSPDGKRLAYTHRSRFGVSLVDLDAVEEAPRLLELELPSIEVTFSTDGTHLATSDGYTVFVFDLCAEPAVRLERPLSEDGCSTTLALQDSQLIVHVEELGLSRELVMVYDMSGEPTENIDVGGWGGMGRTKLAEDGSVLLRADVRSQNRGEAVCLDVLELPGGDLLRSVRLPAARVKQTCRPPGAYARHYAHHITASARARTVVVDIGPANGAGNLFLLNDVIFADPMPRIVDDRDWISSGVWLCPEGRSLYCENEGALWNLDLGGRLGERTA